MMRVPTGWLPHVHRDKFYWFWTPAEWSPTAPLSKGSYFALISQEEFAFMEVFVLGPPSTEPDPAGASERIMKVSLVEDHPDLRTLREGAYQLEAVDGPDALSRMYALDLMGGYGFVTELGPATACHRLTVEYADRVTESFGTTTRTNTRKTTTDLFSLCRRDLVLQLNMKALSSDYAVRARTFEQVAASAQLGRFASGEEADTSGIAKLEQAGDVAGLVKALNEVHTQREGGELDGDQARAMVATRMADMGFDFDIMQGARVHFVDPSKVRVIDDSASVRVEAARALGKLDRPEGNRALVETLKDTTPHVQDAAVEALCRVGGRKMQELLAHFDGKTGFARFAVVEKVRALVEQLAGPSAHGPR